MGAGAGNVEAKPRVSLGGEVKELLESLTWWAWFILILLAAVAALAAFLLGYLIYQGAVKQMIEDHKRRASWLKENGIGRR